MVDGFLNFINQKLPSAFHIRGNREMNGRKFPLAKGRLASHPKPV